MRGKKVLIAGGSGFIGTLLFNHFSANNSVYVLTRNPSESHHIYWNPKLGELDINLIKDIEVIINLSGSSIGMGRWTRNRINRLFSSRIDTTNFLIKKINDLPNVEQFVSISGLDCYGHVQYKTEFRETDPFGSDLLSQISQGWEDTLGALRSEISITILRMALILDGKKGALPVISKPIKRGYGAILGSGNQVVNWIDSKEVPSIFEFVIDKKLEGAFNILQGHATNSELTKTIAKLLNKRIWLPKAPAFVLRLLLGKKSTLVLNGAATSNEKLLNAGYKFETHSLENVLRKHLQ